MNMLLKHGGFVYLVTNKNNTVLYAGVTSELRARIFEHKTKVYPKSFTAKYNCEKIVWHEQHDYIEDAIAREKQIKAGNRKAKEALINKMNPTWKDLWDEIQDL
jgi:putative endonuclease